MKTVSKVSYYFLELKIYGKQALPYWFIHSDTPNLKVGYVPVVLVAIC